MVLCAAAGCASILGIDFGKPYPSDGGEDDGMVSDGAVSDTKKEIEVPPDVNVEANTATCDDFMRGLEDGGVYMSPTGTDNGACTQQQPCLHWNAAIAKAQAANKPIYLFPGDYTAAANGNLVLGSGSVVVEGGWLIDGGVWEPICDFGVARIHGNHQVITGQTVVIAESGSTLTLRLVSVNADPIAASGSSYGVFGNASAGVTLEAVAVHGGAGAPGTNGMGVGVGGPSNCSAGNMGNGGQGAEGQPSGGQYGLTGYVLAGGSTGAVGEAGGGGGSGQTGGTATCAGCMVYFDGGMMMCAPTMTMIMGGSGQPGCGGGGGPGGNPGVGAGASIAVYVTGGTLVIKSGSLINSAVGAAGGNGANGSNGQMGFAGMSGSSMGMSQQSCGGNMCQPMIGSCIAEGGAGGAAGGMGGAGGQGGGGSGGPSIALAYKATVQPDIRDGSTLVWSNGGDGGLPNGNAGDQGQVRTF